MYCDYVIHICMYTITSVLEYKLADVVSHGSVVFHLKVDLAYVVVSVDRGPYRTLSLGEFMLYMVYAVCIQC